jgi:hypothetical protein
MCALCGCGLIRIKGLGVNVYKHELVVDWNDGSFVLRALAQLPWCVQRTTPAEAVAAVRTP